MVDSDFYRSFNHETARLSTRLLVPDDAALWLEYTLDPVATAYTLMPGKTREEMAPFLIEISENRYATGRLGLKALIQKDTGTFVGMCGLTMQEIDDRPEVEIGYHLIRRFWGQGYATEAARMYRDFVFAQSNTESVISIIHPDNRLSQAVALRNGMKTDHRLTTFRGSPVEIYRIHRGTQLPEMAD